MQLEKYFLISVSICNLCAVLLKEISNMKMMFFRPNLLNFSHVSNSALNRKIPFQNRNGNMNVCFILHILQGLFKTLKVDK